MMNKTLEDLKSRRSCRDFKSDMITEEELKAIIEEYENDISLRHIGFPEDWYEQLEK